MENLKQVTKKNPKKVEAGKKGYQARLLKTEGGNTCWLVVLCTTGSNPGTISGTLSGTTGTLVVLLVVIYWYHLWYYCTISPMVPSLYV